MRLKVKQEEDGLWTIMVLKTRPNENESRMLRNVAEEDYERAVEQLVSEVAPGSAGLSAQLS